jgi:hypothetical protein
MEGGASISMWGTGQFVDLSCGSRLLTNFDWNDLKKKW